MVSVPEQQESGCVRGARDVFVLYGLNVGLAALMGPLLSPMFRDMCVCLAQVVPSPMAL